MVTPIAYLLACFPRIMAGHIQGFPSRLTFGHTLEMLAGKNASIKGEELTFDYSE